MSFFRFLRFLISLCVIFEVLRDAGRSRAALHTEVLALRHQLTVLQRSVKRPKLTSSDRSLWATVRMLAGLAISAGDRPTENGHRMAPESISSVLDVEVRTGDEQAVRPFRPKHAN